ncbi:TRPM8 channel-associated factor 2 isoform X1 [Alligator sinensis]|uniref:TRPM8 channel-associated factor 2 isoform X1 n=2 Tax=Alligator sinensis TaxID=38654 RepID=A0A1U7SRC7_ALLSI|nr:TRPM8 channel-associated factor 2 isoform X1 [Alligator sinensis]XP_025047059.1 TRPM8 channel-associated factor 2 isoform X1 [Alligator sinensis]XP_025047060.1 TRPM8 channel-associated factor 2 isoform X1 [Alligator sinensis]
MKPSAIYECLVGGIGQWDFTGDFVPCELLLTGEAAFPVLVSPQKQVLIAVSQFGKGRIVVVSHEEILKNSRFSQFLQNAVDWLRPSPGALVGVHRNFDSLSELLLGAGIKVQLGVGLIASSGVYCIDAYDDTQAKALVQFVKGGGGLLIGGQAWHWASQHGVDRVLFEFPGNRVTSMAGVYFTGNAVETGVFKVSKKIPEIPLTVRHGANLFHDVEFLMHGVTELDIVTGGIPSHLLVHGVLAFPLGLDGSLHCFFAAARYGQGRVVVTSHEGQLCAPKLARFLLNAVNWLDAGRKGLIGVVASLKGLCPILSQEGLKFQVSELRNDMSVYCCSSYSDQEADKIHTFVAEGGGLLIGGQAWYWASQHQDRAAVAEYPGNKILNHFGISILGMNIKADKYPAQLPMEHYHFRHALSLFQRHVDKEEPFQPPLTSWLQRLRQDCSAFLRIPAEDCPTYNSLHLILIKVLRRTGIPRVSKQCPVKSNSKEAVLLSLATELSQNTADCAALVQKPGDGVCLPPSTSRITVEIAGTNAGGTAWRSTGLYLPDGSTAVITLPCTAISAGLQVQIGCHSDDLTNAKELMRAPVVIRKCQVNCQNQSVSCLWGGLIYIVVPGGSQLGKVPIAVEGAIKAPFFRLGETCKRQWQTNIRHYPAPWAELATENLILTVPADNIRHVENPEPLLTLWDQITWAIATLAAAPAKFPRPERIVTDVQISAGWMHAGYPIMGHLDSVKEMVNVEHMRTTGLWGPIHELGHNQQRAGWEFPPHTTEATCNLWSVYVHEKVLGIPRNKAHEALRPACRKERIKGYLEEGAQLKDWSVWTALETYLQLQEGFGWEPFIALFSEYQKILTIPKDNPSKMNMWAQKFSLQVNKNLAPFFMAWGWPIKNEVSSELATLPVWEENPMKKYIPVKI